MYRYFPERAEEERQWGRADGYRLSYRLRFELAIRASLSTKRASESILIRPKISYFDEATKQRFYPHVIEPAAGVNRTVLAVMDAYSEKTNDKGEVRVILKLSSRLGTHQGRDPVAGEEQT